jgi:glycosyltransferase involved in cell wall biosynthesis
MRIGFIGPYFNPRIGSYELNLFKALTKLGHQVTVYTTEDEYPPNFRIRKSVSSKLNVHGFVVKRFKTLLELKVLSSGFPIAPSIFNAIARDKPDVIHAASHEQPLTLLAFLSAKKLKIPFTYTHWCYHYPNAFYGRFWLFVAEHTVFFPIWKYTKKIIAGSLVGKKYLKNILGVPEKRIALINGGAIDIDLFNVSNYDKRNMKAKFGLKEDDWVILTVARLHKAKGLNYLIRAFALIKEELHSANFKLIIVGQGPEKSNLLQLTRKLGISKSVVFVDKEIAYDEMPKIYTIGDVFVLPTLSEQVGRVIIEALAMSLPVVATDVGGIREVIKNLETGLLVSTKNAEGLAKEILHLYEDENLRRKVGIAGRQLVEKSFNYLNMARETLKVYKEIS